MIESDQSDKEQQDEMSPLAVSNNSVDVNEHGKKSNKDKMLEESTSEITKDSYVETSNIKNNEISINNETEIKKEKEPNISLDIKQQENVHIEETMINLKENIENVTEETMEMLDKEDNVKPKRKNRKFKIEDAEVVEGLELSVECASDKGSSSSSESEDRNKRQLMPKTIIIKAKPNDSELEISSSEEENKLDSQNISKLKFKKTVKGKKRNRTSFSAIKNTDSEENNDDNSDEDYSPKTKKKLRKSTKSSTESKKEYNKAKKGMKRSIENLDGEDENSNITEELKSEESISDIKSGKSKSENESEDSENTSSDGKRKKNIKAEDDKRIQMLKKYIRIAGIHVKSYNDLWGNCKSNTAKIRCLKELLTKNGIIGRPTVEKCKKAKKRNERLKDVAELNTSNIISEGRITRAQRNKDPNKESMKVSETPTKHRETRNTFKRVLTVIDSDSE
ncbi:HIRA-interacting protein [Apis cerana cerana]|uniref:HIRA-interacting protein n=1 Tax=Apis cerana cerana TaxID=94128 RepID=A0A2A3ESU5_APICC|nr:HIRA-interacting protein [Apis cerana cerana]